MKEFWYNLTHRTVQDSGGGYPMSWKKDIGDYFYDAFGMIVVILTLPFL